MRTLYIECNMGAAGDMLMSSLYELLEDKEGFLKTMNGLGLPGVHLEGKAASTCGIAGTHMAVMVHGEEETEPAGEIPHGHHDHDCDHCHDHGHEFQTLEGGVVPCCGCCGEHFRTLHGPHKEDADESAEDHDTFQGQVDDTASFSEDAGQGHDHQRHGINEGLLNQECHAPSPPFSASEVEGGFPPPSGAATGTVRLPLRFLRPLMSILITREKALR